MPSSLSIINGIPHSRGGSVDGFCCVPGVHEAEDDLLRLWWSVIKHSWVLRWRGGGCCVRSLVVDCGWKEGHSRWLVGARAGTGEKKGGMVFRRAARAGLCLRNAVSERFVTMKDWAEDKVD